MIHAVARKSHETVARLIVSSRAAPLSDMVLVATLTGPVARYHATIVRSGRFLLSVFRALLRQARELRRQEGMDPPIPANVLGTLDAAEGDLRLLCFKYAALAAAAANRPKPTPIGESEAGAREPGGGSSSSANEAEGAGGGGEEEGGLSEDDLLGLLEKHVSVYC